VKKMLFWFSVTALAAAFTVCAFYPAAWLAPVIERHTDARLTLGDAQGTLWRGSAFLGGAPGPGGAVTPLFPGRFTWSVSPLILLGRVNISLANPEALAQAVSVTGSWSQWQVNAGELILPAESLAGLGAPLNTMAPSGRMRLSWNVLDLARSGQAVSVTGRTVLTMADMGSRVSPVKPLGSYEMALDWHGQNAQLNLRTLKGALLLSGAGALDRGRLTFSGQATAAEGYEESLGNLLNLLGQRRMVNGKNIIALEFK
jgi:general secretion pathway protein N